MKEDIKLVEQMLNSKEPVCNYILKHQEIEAISNLLTRYKQLEEENKRLIKANDNLKSTKRIKTYKEVEKYFIPKSKVKEKIEEIKLSLKDDCLALHEFQRLAKIDVLEELLREE